MKGKAGNAKRIAAVKEKDDRDDLGRRVLDRIMDAGAEREHGEHLAGGGSSAVSMAWAMRLDGNDGTAALPLAASANALAVAPRTRSQQPSMICVSGQSDSGGDDSSPREREDAHASAGHAGQALARARRGGPERRRGRGRAHVQAECLSAQQF